MVVTEIDPINALQAAMEGFEVDDRRGHARHAATSTSRRTGNCDVITLEHMQAMKDQAIVCNIGHFDNEIQVDRLNTAAGVGRTQHQAAGGHATRFPDGHAIYLLAEGRLVNLGCATGHPSFVMSNRFTNQTLAQIDLWTNQDTYQTGRLPPAQEARRGSGAAAPGEDRGEADHASRTSRRSTSACRVDGPYKPEHYRY